MFLNNFYKVFSACAQEVDRFYPVDGDRDDDVMTDFRGLHPVIQMQQPFLKFLFFIGDQNEGDDRLTELRENRSSFSIPVREEASL